MRLFSCLLVAAGGLLVRGQGFAGGVIEAVALGSLCSRNGLVQLGAFSPFFVECNNRVAIVRMCPGRGEIFTQHRCQSAGPEARDESVTFLNEETTRMAEQEQFCGTGALSGIYTARATCSRQALLCNGASPIAVSCPKGYSLQMDLSCREAGQQCYGQPSSPLRDYFLQRLCYPPKNFVKQLLNNQREKCATWYVNCEPRPSVVRCPSGSVFDSTQRQCRPWRQGDNCLMSGSCYGREYRSVSLGDCQKVYFYCDGLQGKYLYCPEGMIFNGYSCVAPETANCPVCQDGHSRPSSSCNQYFFCQNGQWTTQQCNEGTAWNNDHRQCEASYTCASPSACQKEGVVSVSCGKALVCNGFGFDEVKCPSNTMFDERQRKCVYHQSCNKHACREGDVILTPDCQTYRLCKNGQYSLYKCQRSNGQISGYCQACSSQNPYPEQIPNFPAQCQEGALQADQNQCTLYFECSEGQWNPKQCQNGEVWSSQWNKCVPPQYGQGCSVAVESQCQEGERLFSPTETECRRLLECKAARWMEMICPDGYRYDTNTKSCLPGQCSPSNPGPVVLPPDNGPQSPAPPPPPPSDDPGYGIFCSEGEQAADPFDCNKYSACRQGKMATEFCPSGSGYHPTNRRCQEGHFCGAECQEGVVIPLATCGHYKVCVQGKYLDGRCNLNKVFANGQCSDQDCQQQVFYFPDCQEGAVRPPSQQTDPSVYMVCASGRWEERNCGQQAVFNYQRMVCETQGGPLPPPGCYGGETKPIQGSCQEYEICDYGNWKRQRCPYGQKFVNELCVPGDCQERCVEAADAYRRDSYDCSKYYQCVHGTWMQRPCAPGTVFNERVLVCDHRANVPECGGAY